MKKIGLVVIVIGIALAVFTGFDFFTREKIVDVGSVEITADKKHSLDWSPILGLVTAAVGAGIYFAGSRRRSH
jgi:drug/metabolite transporter (DMT)-like permease